MAKPYFYRPFPAYFYGFVILKPAHYFTFWSLCHDYDIPDSGVFYVHRRDLSRAVARRLDQTGSNVNVTAMIKTLADIGAIEIVKTIASTRATMNTEAFELRIVPEVWTWDPPIEASERGYNPATRRAAYLASRDRKQSVSSAV